MKSLTNQSVIRSCTIKTSLVTAFLIVIWCVLPTLAQDKFKGGPPPESDNPKFKTDLEFANMLKSDWQKTQMLPGLAFDAVPKPATPPVAQPPSPQDTTGWTALRQSKPVRTIPAPTPAPAPQPPQPTPPSPQTARVANFNYFAAPVKAQYDASLRVPLGNQVSNALLSAWWEAMSRTHYESCLAQAQYYRKLMNLNDWGYGLWLYDLGQAIYQNSPNEANLFTWFMLVKSGFSAKIGYNHDQVYLLLPFDQVLYGLAHFNLESKDYYLVAYDKKSSPAGSLFIYEGDYPGANRLLSPQVTNCPDIEKIALDRTFKFSYKGQEYSITAKYNKPVIDYFEFYPQTDLNVYFSAALSADASSSLISALKPLVQGKSEAEAVNLLLHFVQSFPYETDQEQFGREKYFFPEEALYYNYTDCEDRSVFFAYLVRNLIGLEVVGLDYPGHVATAVKFSTELPGDFVLYKNQKYLVCDPTYINADPGMSQPQYQAVKPTIIPVSV